MKRVLGGLRRVECAAGMPLHHVKEILGHNVLRNPKKEPIRDATELVMSVTAKDRPNSPW